MIGAGPTMIALFRASRAGPPNSDDDLQPPIRWRRVAWRTGKEGFQAAQQHLAERGISFRGPIDHGCAWSIYFDDPDGNPLEITYYIGTNETKGSYHSPR